MNSLNYIKVFQICDSMFPIGTFNHSFGMENYLSERKIKKAPEFEEWLTNYFKTQFKYGEGLLILLCYQALKDNDLSSIWQYDDEITKAIIAKETRDGAKLITKQMLTLIKKMYGNIDNLNRYEELIKIKKCFGNPAVAFSLFASEKGILKKDAFLMYGYSIASTMVQNAVRAVPLGQSSGQIILKNIINFLEKLYSEIKKIDASYLGANVSGIELAQIRHETQMARLFMS